MSKYRVRRALAGLLTIALLVQCAPSALAGASSGGELLARATATAKPKSKSEGKTEGKTESQSGTTKPATAVPPEEEAEAQTPRPGSKRPEYFANPNVSPAPYNPAVDLENLRPDQLYAECAVLIDANTGRILFDKNAEKRMYPASITKIMTAMLALEHGDLKDEVTAPSAEALNVEPSSLEVQPGEKMTLEDTLSGLMLRSFNDLAVCAAYYVSGSVEEFAKLMNQRAAELGCTDTHFVNPNGLFDAQHYTTAHDMARITRQAIQSEDFRKVISQHLYTLPSLIKQPTPLVIENRNLMLPDSRSSLYSYQGSFGVKTGYVFNSSHTYVGAATRNGVTLIAVVLGTTTSGKWQDTMKLFDYGFAVTRAVNMGDRVNRLGISAQVETTKGASEVLPLRLENPGDPKLVELKDTSAKLSALTQQDIEKMMTIEYLRPLKAPIAEGEEVAILTVRYFECTPVELKLVAAASIPDPAELVSAAVGAGNISTDSGSVLKAPPAAEVVQSVAPAVSAAMADVGIITQVRQLPWTIIAPALLGGFFLLLFMGSLRQTKLRKRKRRVGAAYYSKHYGAVPSRNTRTWR